jgi:hypothetical protein
VILASKCDPRGGNHFFRQKKNDNGAAAERHISPSKATINMKLCGRVYYDMIDTNLWLVAGLELQMR